MATIRIEKTKDFSIVSNAVLAKQQRAERRRPVVTLRVSPATLLVK